MKYTIKTELALRIVCILILIGLNIAIWYNGKDLSCDNCAINFKTNKRLLTASRENIQDFKINISELYQSLIDDKCVIEFDEDYGYRYIK